LCSLFGPRKERVGGALLDARISFANQSREEPWPERSPFPLRWKRNETPGNSPNRQETAIAVSAL
jgi:hypothetical protein